jgi:hypothetical protein
MIVFIITFSIGAFEDTDGRAIYDFQIEPLHSKGTKS